MCGIVGYIGKNNNIKIGLNALKRLEYRGYDCLSPDTLVQLSDGRIKTIKDIEVGFEVSSIDFRNLSFAKGKVAFRGAKNKNKLYKIRTPYFAIESSPDHKFFVYQDGKIVEKRAFELQVGDFLAGQRKMPIKGRLQKLPQIKDTIYYQLTSQGIKEIQDLREKRCFSYNFFERQVGIHHQYAKDYLEGKRATTKENWQRLLPPLKISLRPFLRRFSKKKICSHSFRNIFAGSYLDSELSQIIGYITGDGSRMDPKKDTKIKIEDNKETLKAYQKLFRKKGIKVKLLKHQHKNCWQIRIYSASFGKLLNKIAPGILDSSREREIPEIIQKSFPSCVAGFLRGVFDAEGSVGKKRKNGLSYGVSLYSANERFVRQLQLLFLRFGVISSLCFSNSEKRFNRIAIYKFDSLERFVRFINFSSPVKKKSLQKLLATRKRKMSKYFLNPAIFWTKIRKIETSSSTHLMYDISVSSTQNFIANGLVVHNSAGAAWFNSEKKKIFCVKKVGKVDFLENEILQRNLDLKCNPFIMHSRWATHGKPSIVNAHPHSDCQKKIWLVHNGIVENYKELKEELQKRGHRFKSETDTEVLAHLIEENLKNKNQNLEEATRQTLKQIRGTYGLAVISVDEPEKLVVARSSSPLLIGVGQDEYIVASDAAAIVTHTKKVLYLDDGEIGVITPKGFRIFTLDKREIKKPIAQIDWDIAQAQKRGFAHFMLKEIFEQPEAVENTLRGRLIIDEGLVKLGGLELIADRLRQIKRLIITACGTAYYASLIGEYMLEEYAGLPVEVELGSEFRYRKPILDKKTALLAVSQSGETADTLAAVEEAKRKGALTIGIVNVVGSTIARQTEAGVYNHIGPEIGVASTKAFTSQLTALALLTLFLGRQRQMSLVMGRRIAQELKKIPLYIEQILKQNKEIKRIAKKYSKYQNFLYLGRKYNYPIALEGALKLKEISYIHAEGYGAGEMKHGPIALIDKNFPAFFIIPSDSVYEKMISNLEEIKAREGRIIALATQGNQSIQKLADDIIYIPKTLEMLTPILAVIPLQLFAYHMAVLRKNDPDKPKNLAKSVTVE